MGATHTKTYIPQPRPRRSGRPAVSSPGSLLDGSANRSGERWHICSVSEITTDRIRREFQLACDERGKLTREKFHEALSVLEDLDLRRLRETPLANLLYDLWDKEQANGVDEAEFANGVAILTGTDSYSKIKLTFDAYDTHNKGRGTTISLDQILNVLLDTWLAAFRFLAEQIETLPTNSHLPEPRAVQHFAEQQLHCFRDAALRSLGDFDKYNRQALSLPEFQLWASEDRTVGATCGPASVTLAVTFLNIEKLPLYPAGDKPHTSTTPPT